MTPKRTSKRIGAADGVPLPLIMGNFKQQRRLQGMARKYMKIAMVGQKRVPSHDGGIEVVVGGTGQAHGGAGAFRDVL